VIADVQLYMLVAVNWPIFRGYHGLNWATDIRWLIRLDNMEPFVVRYTTVMEDPIEDLGWCTASDVLLWMSLG